MRRDPPSTTPEKRKQKDSILHSVTKLSNSKYRNQPDSSDDDDNLENPGRRLVERRNSNYSYDGRKEAFLEKIVNNDYITNLNQNPGLEKYLNQCRVQVATAKDLKMYMLTQPFMGVTEELIPQTDSKEKLNLIYLGKQLLLLDLDETLIHSETIEPGTNGSADYDYVISIGSDPNYDVIYLSL